MTVVCLCALARARARVGCHTAACNGGSLHTHTHIDTNTHACAHTFNKCASDAISGGSVSVAVHTILNTHAFLSRDKSRQPPGWCIGRTARIAHDKRGGSARRPHRTVCVCVWKSDCDGSFACITMKYTHTHTCGHVGVQSRTHIAWGKCTQILRTRLACVCMCGDTIKCTRYVERLTFYTVASHVPVCVGMRVFMVLVCRRQLLTTRMLTRHNGIEIDDYRHPQSRVPACTEPMF